MIAAKKRTLFAWCALIFLHSPLQARAQFNDAHYYDNTPVGVSQLELGYSLVRGNAAIDSALVITGANLNLNQASVEYTRYFGLFHRTTWVEVTVPVAGLRGSLDGLTVEGSTAGAGDSSYRVTMLAKGGPALNVAQFDNYRPTTRLGVSLIVTAPTGLYNANKLLNLGSHRWSVKPELAVSYPFGPDEKWQVDVYANAYFYTDNTTFHGREILRQEPLAGLEGHISYSFKDKLWTSLDTRYSVRGATLIDGVHQDNAQENVTLGTELNVPLNARHSLLFEFAKAVVHRNSPALAGFSVKYDYVWGKGYR